MIENKPRSCGDCSACCEGWLHGEAHGHKFWPGRQCHFNGKNGCTIYEDRPENPCKSFKCLWLSGEQNVPAWMKPDECKVILSYQNKNGKPYILVSEAGKPLSAEVLSWLFMEYFNGNIGNFAYELNGGMNFVGDNEFLNT
jgi:hypothetical protein